MRRKLLRIHTGQIELFLKSPEDFGGLRSVGIPADAVITGSQFDPLSSQIILVLESATFEEVTHGCTFPEMAGFRFTREDKG